MSNFTDMLYIFTDVKMLSHKIISSNFKFILRMANIAIICIDFMINEFIFGSNY